MDGPYRLREGVGNDCCVEITEPVCFHQPATCHPELRCRCARVCIYVCTHTRKLKNKPSGTGPSLSLRNSPVFCSMFLNLSLLAFCCLFVCLFLSKAGLMGLGDTYFTRDWLSSHHVRGIFREPCLLLFTLAAVAWPGLCLSDFCVKSPTIQTTLQEARHPPGAHSGSSASR